jgi:GNAT superfamily N-acetyltransferase
MEVSFLHTRRVIAPPDHQARAMIFCAPPMDWIIAQGRDSGLSIEDRAVLVGALAECQLLATAPRWRGNGYAMRLMGDLEDRYRAAGYRAIFVVVEHDNVAAVDWYRKYGFTIGDLGTKPVIQFWRHRMHQNARYDHLDDGQLIGFKALHDGVDIIKLAGTVHVRGLMEDIPETF